MISCELKDAIDKLLMQDPVVRATFISCWRDGLSEVDTLAHVVLNLAASKDAITKEYLAHAQMNIKPQLISAVQGVKIDEKSNEQQEIEKEAAIRLETENQRAKQNFEYRVERFMAGIPAGVKYEWPYTDAFDDGGIAFHEAKRRLAAKS